MDIIFHRIDGILKKILMLTMFVEVSFIIHMIYASLIRPLLEDIFPALLNNNLVFPFQLILVAYIVYLMLYVGSMLYAVCFTMLFNFSYCNVLRRF